MHTPSTPKVAIRHLTVTFPKNTGITTALKDVSLDIFGGTVVAFVGPSGCGKTTALKSMNRMNEIIPGARTEGTITLDGMNIHDPTVETTILRRRVGIVFQKPQVFPHKSIFENVAYPLQLQGLASGDGEMRDMVHHHLEQAALLEEVAKSLSGSALELSVGQQQRLCIARTLAQKPEVILMDEPCSALDWPNTEKINRMILNMCEEGLTIVIVTHNIQQASYVSDRTIFFWMGEKIADDRTEKILLTPPDDPRIQNFVRTRFDEAAKP